MTIFCNKNSPILAKVVQKVSTAVFAQKGCVQNGPKVTKYLGSFRKEKCREEHLKNRPIWSHWQGSEKQATGFSRKKTFVSTSTGGLSTSVSFFLFLSLSLFRGPFYIMLICLYHFFLYHSIYLSIYLPISYISLYQSNYLTITYLPIFLSTYICQSIYLPITYLSMLITL